MDLSALESSIKTLENSLDCWAVWLLLATLAVVVGLIFEYWDEVPDLLKKRPFRWTHGLKILGAILITVGVAGELWVEYKASKVETKLRAANGQVIAALTIKAGEAQVSADRAANDASSAGLSAQKANRDAEIAKTRAADVGKQADELSRKTSELAKNLEDSQNAELAERRKVLELENSLAPRMLDIEIEGGGKTSFDDLKPFAGTQVMFEVLTDAESRRAAQEIGNVITFAGWKITDTVSNPELYSGFFDGVTIWYGQPGFSPTEFSAGQEPKRKEGERCREAADALAAYLLSRNWKSMARANFASAGTKIPNIETKIPPNTLMIVVGFKPNPFFEPDWAKQMEERYKRFILQEREREKAFPRPPPIKYSKLAHHPQSSVFSFYRGE